MQKSVLLGKTLEELTQIVVELGMRRFVGAQLAEWLYKKRAATYEEFRNLSKQNIELLSAHYDVGRTPPAQSTTSVDGTVKYLFETAQNNAIESVYIPSSTSRTLCISSQAGCRMGCRFCMTARLGFKQNLSAAEIINQVLSVEESGELTNIVYMGMGEPMDNLEEVLRSCEILTAPWGLAWSPTRITVSSIGVMPALQSLIERSKVNIAISLHNPFDQERKEIMPAQQKHKLSEVLALLRGYDFTHQRRLSFEYILFDGLNDSGRHVEELVEQLSDFRECRVNLIRFHQIPDSPLRGSNPQRIKEFNGALNSAGVVTTTRASRGEDILAACGMLAANSKK